MLAVVAAVAVVPGRCRRGCRSNSLAAATKLASEPTALPWDRIGLTTGQARWYWLRAVSAEGNVSALAGPVTATAL